MTDPERIAQGYNSSSVDASLSRIFEKLETQDREAREYRAEAKAAMAQVLVEVRKTNGRVTSLEHFRTSMKAKLAVVSGLISAAVALAAWLVERVMG